jgi:siroheme synthase-like protein
MELFPFFQDISDKTFLVIGAGKVAQEKVHRLLLFQTHIVVLAKEVPEEFEAFFRESGIPVQQEAYRREVLSLGDYIIAATNDQSLNQQIAEDAGEQRKPINVVDNAELCTFIFPAVVKNGDLAVGITTNGKSPAASSYVRKTLEEMLPEHMGDIIRRMGEMRNRISEEIGSQQMRKAFYQQVLALLIETDNQATEAEIEEILRKPL